MNVCMFTKEKIHTCKALLKVSKTNKQKKSQFIVDIWRSIQSLLLTTFRVEQVLFSMYVLMGINTTWASNQTSEKHSSTPYTES